MKQYAVNEIFYSLQGEGVRAGTANIFVRFSGCNLRCDIPEGPKSPGGFMCDTEWESGRLLSLDQLLKEIIECSSVCKNIIFTGGEPGLQIDDDLVLKLRALGYFLAIESNGTLALPLLDWICISPKVAEHALKQPVADEVKYVRSYKQGIPKPVIKAKHFLISPAFDAGRLDQKNLEWCINLVKENPQWRLSVQQHKFWSVR